MLAPSTNTSPRHRGAAPPLPAAGLHFVALTEPLHTELPAAQHTFMFVMQAVMKCAQLLMSSASPSKNVAAAKAFNATSGSAAAARAQPAGRRRASQDVKPLIASQASSSRRRVGKEREEERLQRSIVLSSCHERI